MKGLGLTRLSIDMALTFGRQFLAGFLQLGIIMFVTRQLGPEGAGAYAIAILLPTFLAQLLNLGLASANVYYIASKKFELKQAWTASRDLILCMSVFGLVIGGGIIAWQGSSLFPGIDQGFLFIAMLIFPTSLMNGIVKSLCRALEDFRTFNILVLIQPVATLLLISCLWSVSASSLPGVLGASALAHAFALISGFLMMRTSVSFFARPVDAPRYLRSALQYGMKAHLGNLAAFLIYRVDILLVNFFVGPAGAGIYLVAVRLVEQLWMVSQAVSTVLFPRLSKMIGDDGGRVALTSIISRFVLWGTILAAVILAAVAGPIIQVFFGSHFRSATMVLFVLLPGIVLFSCARILANDFAARGLVGINLLFAVGVLIANLIGNLFFIPAYGIIGAALATTVSYSLDLIFRLAVLQRLSGIIWWQVLVPTLGDIHLLKKAFKRKKIP